MHTRTLDGIAVSEVGLGCWQFGGDWGQIDDSETITPRRRSQSDGLCV